jgi:periplasmic divalent cation tolerance protein
MTIVTAWVIIHEKETAVRVGREILESRLAAGYNLFPVESAFWWKGRILEENETLMVFKTRSEHAGLIAEHVARSTGAEVPDVFVLDSPPLDERYSSWVASETTG